jgi:hypothetical protein
LAVAVFDDDDVLDKIPQGIVAAVFEFLYTLKRRRIREWKENTAIYSHYLCPCFLFLVRPLAIIC